jgi:hypothetical protein
MTAAKKDTIGDTDNRKRHWVKNLCNGMKKPTGGTGKIGESIHKCVAIKRLILNKTHSDLLGLSPDGDANLEDDSAGSVIEDEGDEHNMYTSFDNDSTGVAWDEARQASLL